VARLLLKHFTNLVPLGEATPRPDAAIFTRSSHKTTRPETAPSLLRWVAVQYPVYRSPPRATAILADAWVQEMRCKQPDRGPAVEKGLRKGVEHG